MRTTLCGVLALGLSVAAQTAPPTIHAEARALQPGEVVALTVRGWTTETAPRVRVFSRTTPAFKTNDGAWRALVGIDLDVAPGAYRCPCWVLRRLRSPPRRSPSRARRFRRAGSRWIRDSSNRRQPRRHASRATPRTWPPLWAASADRRLWDGPFAPPVPDAANSAFGSRSVFNGQARSPHGGADFASPSGRAVVAPNSGTVLLARDLYYTGQTVVVDHGLGLLSLFAHLSAIDVTEGTEVKTGDALGQVGATGRVTGPHLHWTVRLGGARVDPLALIEVTSGRVPAS